jgi:tRNA-splicing ligase RtcB (3'-phosphate/5'-hydroxy nucleic acid ligase)
MTEYGIIQLSEYKWEVKKDENIGMRVPGIIYSDDKLIKHCRKEGVIGQVVNVATLPGILKASFAMPDIHFGYGFPIGGVAAFDPEAGGIISPGGVGFDISCGVRAIRTGLVVDDIKNKMEDMMSFISFSIPRGLGGKGKINLSKKDMEEVLSDGIEWAVSRGYCDEEEKQYIEEGGTVKEADPAYVSEEAKKRGYGQLGTLGSGNHFVEIQAVDRIYDKYAADVLGIGEAGIVIMIHTGSRGPGHQICSDYVRIMQKASSKYGIRLPDKQLACAPVYSDEGKNYYKAMACGANYAMVNRQCLAYQATRALKKYLGESPDSPDISTIYDVSHNIARLEEHDIGGGRRKVCVHRKGATRSFGPGRPELSSVYREIGQPVIIPGDMGTYSFILLGTKTAMAESFGSTCHGAGRMMSRSKAKKTIRGDELKKSLKTEKGIIVIADSMPGLAEEAPQAYKDISSVVNVSCMAGLSKKVARLRPLGVIKG